MTSFEEYIDQYHRLFTDADKAYWGVLDALDALADAIDSLAIASGKQTADMLRLQREHDGLQQKYDALHERCSGAPVVKENESTETDTEPLTLGEALNQVFEGLFSPGEPSYIDELADVAKPKTIDDRKDIEPIVGSYSAPEPELVPASIESLLDGTNKTPRVDYNENVWRFDSYQNWWWTVDPIDGELYLASSLGEVRKNFGLDRFWTVTDDKDLSVELWNERNTRPRIDGAGRLWRYNGERSLWWTVNGGTLNTSRTCADIDAAYGLLRFAEVY